MMCRKTLKQKQTYQTLYTDTALAHTQQPRGHLHTDSGIWTNILRLCACINIMHKHIYCYELGHFLLLRNNEHIVDHVDQWDGPSSFYICETIFLYNFNLKKKVFI